MTLFESLSLKPNQIRTSVPLAVLKELDKKSDANNRKLVEIDRKTNNFLQKGFSVSDSNEIVMAGDSWFSGTGVSAGYAVILASKLEKTRINYGFSGRTITNLLAVPTVANGIITNTDFSARPTIINYGLNDYRKYLLKFLYSFLLFYFLLIFDY